METNYSPVVDLWEKEYSSQLRKNVPFNLSEQFQRMASIFSPGMSYYYIMNLENLHLEYISPEVQRITGIPSEEASIQQLVGTALNEEIPLLVKKEQVIKDFYGRFLSAEDITKYKIVYTYRMKDRKGNQRHMLHQAVSLSISDCGKAQHVLSIHSDVSHLKLPNNKNVSFISLSNQKSYLNVAVDEGAFNPEAVILNKKELSNVLSLREKEILDLLAKGHNAEQISEMLHLSFNTVRTHRKNMLKKSNCSNTTELVVQALMEGLIG